MRAKKQLKHLEYLDGLRGLAVIMVVVTHVSQHLGPGGFRNQYFSQLVAAGDRGVQLFFILSALTLFFSQSSRSKPELKQSFYVRRFFRIFPFWLLMATFWGVYYSVGIPSWAASVAFLWGFIRFLPGVEFIPGGWTLFVEVTFYSIFPFLYKKVRNQYIAASGFIIMVIVSIFWEQMASQVWLLSGNGNTFFSPIAQFYNFFLGILAFFLIFKGNVLKKIKNKDLSTSLAWASILMCILFISGEYRLASISLFLLTLAASLKGNFLNRIMRGKILGVYGKYSYSIYLLQFILLIYLPTIMRPIYQVFGVTAASYEIKLILSVPAALAILLAVAHITFKYLESPTINIGRAISRRLG